ncbi:MAG TPA: nucleotide sugar dehydrogenase [Ornithinimicrobium sp.]|uniref:nucleotide sugar dehydrogenase n=1 Tax=Ornithinimicrobium sp. TaxID=1977084 RepID=UPI002B45A94D|nr:nucleotide sugar dehydrogenase [Ornithinimicrobium sp.]HKJ13079.1 nucleotide sugar dehydrogenase [Ornithinimicrobium sp.]
MKVAVVALGKVGLPLAVQFAAAGHTVVGVDIDAALVEQVNGGASPYPGEADLAERLAEARADGRFHATTDYARAVPGADVVVVVVPLVVDADAAPDFTALDAATRSLAVHLRPGALVSYETTVPVGTTRGRFAPMVEAESGLTQGSDVHVVFSPERVFSGRVFADLARYPKLVGGLSETGAHVARRFYGSSLRFDPRDDLPRPNGVWDMGSAEAAELAKLAETTYRDVNIALANRFATFADRTGIEVDRVIEACNSQPYSHLHRPGIAVGGHCIPVYPQLYLAGDPDAALVRAAREQNAAMPEYAVARAAQLLGSLDGMRVAVLGAAYRGGVKETAFSGVFDTVAALDRRGARVGVHDPLYAPEELAELGWRPYRLGEEVDVAVVQADHAEYARLRAADLPGLRLLLDGRGVTDPAAFRGVPRVTIGGGDQTPGVPGR